MNKICLAWILGSCLWFPSYWTTWSISCFMFDFVYGMPCLFVKSLQLMLCISSIGGLWITYIKQKLEIKNFFPIDFYLDGYILVCVDIVTHQLPVLAVHQRQTTICNNHNHIIYFLPCYLLLGLYVFLNNPYTRYEMKWIDIAIGFLVSHLLHFIMFEIDFRKPLTES